MSKPVRRMFALDVLRGVAILLVILHHTGIPEDFGADGGVVFHAVASVAWAGVDLFFVLSGFLISGLLFKEIEETGRLNLKRFWLRRGLKIWPSYFATYGALLLLNAANDLRLHESARVTSALYHALPNLLLIQNYFPMAFQWPQSWSLAVEEHFYLALPLVLAGLVARARARGGRSAEPYRFDGFFAGGVAFCVVVLLGRFVDAGTAVPNAYYPTHFRADSLAFGVMLGWLFHYRRPTFAKVAKLWPVSLVLAPLALASILPLGCPFPGFPPAPGEPPHSGNYWSAFTIGFTLLYLGFGGLVVAAGEYPDAGLRGPVVLRAPLRAIAFVGGYSYTIYLAHAFVMRMPGFWGLIRTTRRVPLLDTNWTGRVLLFAIAIPLGIAIAHLVERPVLKLRERRWPSRA